MKEPSEIDVEELVRAVYFYFSEYYGDGASQWLDIHESHICDELGVPFRGDTWEGEWEKAKEDFHEIYWPIDPSDDFELHAVSPAEDRQVWL